jgi:integrase
LRRDQIHAAVSALVECGTKPTTILSLADLVTPDNVKSILRRRLESVGGEENTFNHNLGRALVQIAREWVKVDALVLAELKRLFGKLPVPVMGLTNKNKRFLRQFDDPKALRRLVELPERLWAEVRQDTKPSFRTLAKAQVALAISILTYMGLRLQNLSHLAFDTHVFIREGAGAISTLELSAGEVKNRIELAFDIPPKVAKMLLEYRERIAPRIIGHRPTRLFVNVDGTPKSEKTVAWLIASYSKRRAGIVLTPHQFRHLNAKVLLDAEPGGFETVKQLLGHKSLKTTVAAYAGIDSRRAARHHQRLIENAIAAQQPSRPRRSPHQGRPWH